MIVFIGNFLTSHGYNPTFLELISNDLSKKYSILNLSNKKNIFFRLFDMILGFYKNKKVIKLVIIDTYSTNAYYFSLLLSILCYLNNKPYILVLSGGNLENRLKKNSLFIFILKNAHNIVTPSRYLFNIFKKSIRSILYIPNYLSLNSYEFKKRESINPKLLWVRSIHKIYNPKMAILTLKKIKKRFPNAHLCMVGPYKDDSILELNRIIMENNLVQNIIFTNRLAKSEWIDLSNQYDVFINTTNYDNHPVSILEAMALGLPIVSTNVGGISSLLEHNITAKLVPPNDVLSMVDSIFEYLYNDTERIKISLNARKKIEKEFNKTEVIKEWYKVIDNIII